MGRITCEQKGECFFLTFLKEDVEDEKDGLRQGDEVSFFVSTHKRTGAVRAVQIILLRHCEEKKAQGIVASLKDSFGFIERADEASEIFFHHSEVDGGIEILRVGSHVEFVIQDRHVSWYCLELYILGTQPFLEEHFSCFAIFQLG
jgi:cold shock CspA family protein